MRRKCLLSTALMAGLLSACGTGNTSSLRDNNNSADWTQTFNSQQILADNVQSCYPSAEADVQNQSVAYEAKCTASGGQYSFKIDSESYHALLPAPGFPNQVVCWASATGSCTFIQANDFVEITEDSDLYDLSGTVVGQVKKGSVYRVSKLEGDWVFLTTPAGASVTGVISVKKLQKETVVEIIADTDLYSGSTVVGHAKKGEQYLKGETQGNWISLMKLDGTPVTGWIAANELKDS